MKLPGLPKGQRRMHRNLGVQPCKANPQTNRDCSRVVVHDNVAAQLCDAFPHPHTLKRGS
jgi:hypothetical protein